ncbi:MAG: glycosyltransferase family 2 protein [Gammaproteobacteria bacterium]|nr:glycosyltransferase family 2 protein [Gammaproteobacteria bacterium]
MTANDQLMVSIIVPVFNVGAYIEEGLQSLAQQDFAHDYEIILVDDCSTDDSIEICRQFTHDLPNRFKLIESETNGGVSIARNLGLDKASGRYLMCVDPDDILPASALTEMFDAIEHYGADVIKGNLTLFDEKSRRSAPDSVNATTLLSGADVLTALYEHARVRGHIGGKMYRRDKFGALRLPVGVRMAQDLLFFSELFASAESLVLLNKDIYYYRKHLTGSTGRKYEKGSYIDWISAVESCGKFASNPRQKKAHKDLLVRTMTQVARECRKIPAVSAEPVLNTIEQKCQQWDIRFFHLILADGLGLRSLSRYIKLRLALKQIRRNLSQA